MCTWLVPDVQSARQPHNVLNSNIKTFRRRFAIFSIPRFFRGRPRHVCLVAISSSSKCPQKSTGRPVSAYELWRTSHERAVDRLETTIVAAVLWVWHFASFGMQTCTYVRISTRQMPVTRNGVVTIFHQFRPFDRSGRTILGIAANDETVIEAIFFGHRRTNVNIKNTSDQVFFPTIIRYSLAIFCNKNLCISREQSQDRCW